MTDVDDAFAAYQETLESTQAREDLGLPEHFKLREVVKRGWTLRDHFLAGSHRRDPTKQIWDVDLFAVIDPDGPQGGFRGMHPSVALRELRTVLLNRYSRAVIGATACTVRFGYGNDVTACDVVPAFEREGGGWEIPDVAHSKWISVDPRIVHEPSDQQRAQRDSESSASFTTLVEMVQGINRTFDEPVASAFLEVMAQALVVAPFGRYQDEIAWYLATVFERLTEERSDTELTASAVPGGMLASDQRKAAISLSEWQQIAARAVYLEDVEKSAAAIDEWTKLFGWAPRAVSTRR